MPDRHFELPAHPNLEYYRKQAKHLQHTYVTQLHDLIESRSRQA